jgi:hypothetical protein
VAAKPNKPSNQIKQQPVFGKTAVVYSFPEGETGPIQIGVNFGLAPEPVQYYYSDSVYLALDEELRMALLSFGRREVSTNKFGERIEIVMPARALFAQFWSSSKEVQVTVDKIFESAGSKFKERPMASPDAPPVASIFANLIFVAVGEGESVLDFYQLSPREVHFAKTQKKDMNLQPAIRVFASTVLMRHFFNLLRPHAQDHPDIQVQGENIRAASR